uniref:Limiting CO2-inducible protein B/C beta carbonyic anhydrase domain-containing protein n=1 Tax=Alexandrium monilatum TaxID=311494 RepID=A0A7S4SMD9_9DINO
MVATTSRAAPRRQSRLRLGVLAALAGLTVLSLTRRAHDEGVAPEPEPELAFLGSQGKIVSTVCEAFPGARSGADVMRTMLKAVKPYGLTRANTMYGQSICSDEINSDPGHLSTLLTKYYGREFHLGGIGGAPYVGKTGFMAFSHHVPKNGHVFVLFGPHIGFSPDGVPGQFLRLGQDHPSTSCGAAIAALGQVTSGAKIPADDSDIMQGWLRNRLAPHCPEITAAKYPMIELAIRNYQVAEKEMVNIVNNDYGPGKLILLGGIQINMPYPMPGYFLPMHFSVRARDMAPVDLMSKLGVLRPKF